MVIKDRVYGTIDLGPGVLSALINSKPLQRLKGIGQYGIPDEYYHLKNFSRYEHSIGVMILLKRLGASEEEQIAGLLHDVSHTAFSHTIDWVMGEGGNEDYQDRQHGHFLKNSGLTAILSKYGYQIDRIIDYHHYGLLERDIPDLCADRIDYSLRESPAVVIQKCLPKLVSRDNRIVFTDQQAAAIFAKQFLRIQSEHWGGYEAVARYRIFADMLKQALDDKTISLDDFWENDAFVITKLKTSKNIAVIQTLKILSNKSLANLAKDGKKSYKKFRYVDPLFINGNKTERLSSFEPSFYKELKEARSANQLGIVVPKIHITAKT